MVVLDPGFQTSDLHLWGIPQNEHRNYRFQLQTWNSSHEFNLHWNHVQSYVTYHISKTYHISYFNPTHHLSFTILKPALSRPLRLSVSWRTFWWPTPSPRTWKSSYRTTCRGTGRPPPANRHAKRRCRPRGGKKMGWNDFQQGENARESIYIYIYDLGKMLEASMGN